MHCYSHWGWETPKQLCFACEHRPFPSSSRFVDCTFFAIFLTVLFTEMPVWWAFLCPHSPLLFHVYPPLGIFGWVVHTRPHFEGQKLKFSNVSNSGDIEFEVTNGFRLRNDGPGGYHLGEGQVYFPPKAPPPRAPGRSPTPSGRSTRSSRTRGCRSSGWRPAGTATTSTPPPSRRAPSASSTVPAQPSPAPVSTALFLGGEGGSTSGEMYRSPSKKKQDRGHYLGSVAGNWQLFFIY